VFRRNASYVDEIYYCSIASGSKLKTPFFV